MADYLVAVAQSGQQEIARASLDKESFVSYFPKFRKRVVVRGHKIWLERYLFGRYFFVMLNDHWEKIFGMRGIIDILKSVNNNPSPVCESIIKEIKSCEVHGFVQIKPKPRFRRGQEVRVTKGPFSGQLGLFDGMGPRDCERALLGILGGYVPVELDAGTLVPA